MSWPLSQDFNEAIQSPASSFADEELKSGEVALGPLGIPIPRSGNFADVYQITTKAGRKWAVKCFTRRVTGLQERYARIDEHLSRVRLPFKVRFNYLEQGIRVRGQWYPIVKMEWVEGFTLNEFVRDNLNKPMYLHALLQMWGKLCSRLRESDTAHADLQHGNVLLVPGATPNKLGLKLIDYDGMWVPTLAERHSGEIGHPNYQHPLRLKDKLYTADVDRFPHLVIATALRALLVGGKPLWDQFDNGDNLLFKESDLRDVANSPLFKSLWSYPDPVLKALVGNLALAVGQPLNKTPWLDEILFDPKGPELQKARAKQVAAILNLDTASKSKTLPVVPSQEVRAEYNVFADLDFEGIEQPPPLPRAGRPELPSPRRRGHGGAVPWLVGGGIALVFLAAFFIGMSGGNPTDENGEEKELVRNETGEEFVVPELVKAPREVKDEKKAPPPEVQKKEPNQVAEFELVPEPRLVVEKPQNTLTELTKTLDKLPAVYTSFEVSADGKHLLAFEPGGRIEVLDAKTGESLKQLRVRLMRSQSLEAVTFGDEDFLYVLKSQGDQQKLEEWSWRKDRQTTLDFEAFPVKEKMTGLHFLPKRQRLLSFGNSTKMLLWNLNGKVDQELQPLSLVIQHVQVAPDERDALVQMNGTRLVLWNLVQQRPTADFAIPPNTKLERVALSPTKQFAAAQATVDGKSQVLIWDCSTSRVVDTQEMRFGSEMYFTPDGNFLLGLLDETHLGGVDLSRKSQLPPATLTQPARALVVQPGENSLFSADEDRAIRLSKLTLPTPAGMVGMPKKEPNKDGEGLLKTSEMLKGVVGRMVFTQDGGKLIAGTRDGFVYTLDPKTLKDEDGFAATQGALIDMILTPRTGLGTNVTPEQLLTLGDDLKIRLWNLKDSTQVKEFPSDKFFTKQNNLRLSVTPDGSTVIGRDANRFKAYDLRTAKEVVVGPTLKGTLRELGFSQEGKLAFAIGVDKVVSVLDPRTWKEVRSIDSGVDLRNLLYAPETKMIVGVFRDTIRVLENAPKGKELHKLEHTGNVFDLALVPGQARVVSLTRGTQPSLRVWDLRTGNLLGRYDVPGTPQRLAVAPDGKHAVVSDANATVSLFGLPAREEKK